MSCSSDKRDKLKAGPFDKLIRWLAGAKAASGLTAHALSLPPNMPQLTPETRKCMQNFVNALPDFIRPSSFRSVRRKANRWTAGTVMNTQIIS
jgi:hypothetical protein